MMLGQDEAQLRQRLWVARLRRAVTHERAARVWSVSRRLLAELDTVFHENRRLRRRTRWLTRTRRPLPRVLGTP